MTGGGARPVQPQQRTSRTLASSAAGTSAGLLSSALMLLLITPDTDTLPVRLCTRAPIPTIRKARCNGMGRSCLNRQPLAHAPFFRRPHRSRPPILGCCPLPKLNWRIFARCQGLTTLQASAAGMSGIRRPASSCLRTHLTPTLLYCCRPRVGAGRPALHWAPASTVGPEGRV